MNGTGWQFDMAYMPLCPKASLSGFIVLANREWSWKMAWLPGFLPLE